MTTPEDYQPAPLPEARNAVEEAITSRHSTRAFKSDPVDPTLIRHIIEVAARAPSGTNTQPWHIHVCAGSVRNALVAEQHGAHMAGQPADASEYRYYPDELGEPWKSRQRGLGWDLYGLLGIQKGQTDKMKAQHGRNYLLFDAPVGLFFSIHQKLEYGSWIDLGAFMQSIMVAARSHGLDTCPQQSWCNYHSIVKKHLKIPAEHTLAFGMAMGYADTGAVENRLISRREPLENFASFHGFD
ncbi:MAG: nitroreductase [Pseudomonadota bacterium]